MKVTFESNGEPSGMLCTAMEPCSVGVLTQTGGVAPIGSPVIRVMDELFFPLSETWNEVSGKYHYRPLKPGEKIIIEG